jgi:hypothetical protein
MKISLNDLLANSRIEGIDLDSKLGSDLGSDIGSDLDPKLDFQMNIAIVSWPPIALEVSDPVYVAFR